MNDNIKQKLLKLKDDGLVIICNEQEAKQLFNMKFPYKIKDLSTHSRFIYSYREQGFYFKDSPHNTFSSAKYFLVTKPYRDKIVYFKDFFNISQNYEIY